MPVDTYPSYSVELSNLTQGGEHGFCDTSSCRRGCDWPECDFIWPGPRAKQVAVVTLHNGSACFADRRLAVKWTRLRHSHDRRGAEWRIRRETLIRAPSLRYGRFLPIHGRTLSR